MRVGKRFSRKQIKHIKESLKQHSTNEVLDEIEQQIDEQHDTVKTMSEVRNALKRLIEEDGYDLIAPGIQNVWICQVGSKDVYGSFEGFKENILNSTVTAEYTEYTEYTEEILLL